MKTFIIALLLLLFAHQLNGQRGIFIKKDKSTGIITKSSISETVAYIADPNYRSDLYQKNPDNIKFKLIQTIAKDTTMKVYVNIIRFTERCLGADSKLLIKTGENLVTLKLSGVKHCGNILEDYAVLSPNDIKLLKKNEMDGLKIHYKNSDEFDNEATYDDRCEQLNPKYFIKTLRYFDR